jgi:Nif-specific regulatory protein
LIPSTPPPSVSERRNREVTAAARRSFPRALEDAVGAYEKDLIQDALKTTRGNRAKAARLLDTTERIINYKVKNYGIDARRFKS